MTIQAIRNAVSNFAFVTVPKVAHAAIDNRAGNAALAVFKAGAGFVSNHRKGIALAGVVYFVIRLGRSRSHDLEQFLEYCTLSSKARQLLGYARAESEKNKGIPLVPVYRQFGENMTGRLGCMRGDQPVGEINLKEMTFTPYDRQKLDAEDLKELAAFKLLPAILTK